MQLWFTCFVVALALLFSVQCTVILSASVEFTDYTDKGQKAMLYIPNITKRVALSIEGPMDITKNESKGSIAIDDPKILQGEYTLNLSDDSKYLTFILFRGTIPIGKFTGGTVASSKVSSLNGTATVYQTQQ
ncbi:hypothetical protein EC973_001389 [Apophysomyces ossiformis]|uniref:Uncharacterized protein n=1 Tax=Apophysomyces ossiformis TaxID=679940 RepID=A0A8H7BY18_9FUNG|nr:hypothetical protein EC973_001389 [Apophysomyces ossiformis]